MVGTLNLISVYFAVLFVGLGVDFGLQFSVRYRAERHANDNLREALIEAGRRAGAPLTLAALATAAGFLSFLPTVYKGVSELGLIAGAGMIVAFATSITLLPALLSVLKPPREPAQLGYKALAPVDDFLARHRIPILIITLAVVAAGLPLLYWLRFDFNPINLRSPKTEAVATYLSLKSDPESGANDIQILEPTLMAADQMAPKLSKLPEVARVRTLSTFIPDQQEKLPLIQDAAKTLDPVLNPTAPTPPPTDAQNVSMMDSPSTFSTGWPAPVQARARSRRAGWRPPWRRWPKPSSGAPARRNHIRAAAAYRARRPAQSIQGAGGDARESSAGPYRSMGDGAGQARVDVAPAAIPTIIRYYNISRVPFSRWRRMRPKDRFRFSRRAARWSAPSSKPAPARSFRSRSCCGSHCAG